MRRPESARRVLAYAAVLACGLALPASAQQRAREAPFSFAVLGHLRGGPDGLLNPKVAELVDRLRQQRPDLVILTGDVVWGDFLSAPSRTDVLEREWGRVDSALAPLGVPIYRTPGNHDLSDGATREVLDRRYGLPPAVKVFGNSRFILLRTPYLPRPGEVIVPTAKRVGGLDLDSAQLAFLRRTLADTGYAHTFVFLHHLLWWEPEGGRWWREVHPLLAAARVDAVFSGDYGPMKFSTMERDGVRYFQGAIEPQVDVVRLGHIVRSRLLSSQFDTYFLVRVQGDSAAVAVQTVAEVSSGEFTPERYRAIESAPPLPWQVRIGILWRDRRRLLLAALAGAFGCFAAGVVAGRVWAARAPGRFRYM